MIDCNKLTERQKLIVVLHELGHLKCLIEEMLESSRHGTWQRTWL